ncbi:MAG: exopolysaccharide biosynthesis polyprenyl glycosylphosphotransferase [Candidatus Gastranaerophilales bacterium]|nr:exopolysaccharide biosynthesis polyprenyl glycosylphosphotransferase [Candidatus Gastranaerophilales bacterium]
MAIKHNLDEDKLKFVRIVFDLYRRMKMGITMEEMKASTTLPSVKYLASGDKSKNLLLSAKYKFWISRNFNIGLRKPFQWALKRLFDFILSFTGIIIIFPILLIIAAAIKLESDGPVFFKQKRVGLYGREFYMYKFRSMRQNAEESLDLLKDMNETNSIMFKMSEDPRITNIGRLIRKYSLDELPQLFNVLKGEMSLIGPRPPLPDEVEKYENWHYIKFSTYPGLTGLWQVSGRASIKDFNLVVKLDFKYAENWNLFQDLCILLKTIPVVIGAKGAS